MSAVVKKNKTFAQKFVITHLRKTANGAVEIGGVDKDGNHQYIEWMG